MTDHQTRIPSRNWRDSNLKDIIFPNLFVHFTSGRACYGPPLLREFLMNRDKRREEKVNLEDLPPHFRSQKESYPLIKLVIVRMSFSFCKDSLGILRYTVSDHLESHIGSWSCRSYWDPEQSCVLNPNYNEVWLA